MREENDDVVDFSRFEVSPINHVGATDFSSTNTIRLHGISSVLQQFHWPLPSLEAAMESDVQLAARARSTRRWDVDVANVVHAHR